MSASAPPADVRTLTLTIGQRLGQQRAAHNISERQAAESLNISRVRLSFWDTGATCPTVTHTIAYACLVRRQLVARRGDEIVEVSSILGDLGAFRRSHGLSQPALNRRTRGLTDAAILEMRARRGLPMRLATLGQYFAGLGYGLDLVDASGELCAAPSLSVSSGEADTRG